MTSQAQYTRAHAYSLGVAGWAPVLTHGTVGSMVDRLVHTHQLAEYPGIEVLTCMSLGVKHQPLSFLCRDTL